MANVLGDLLVSIGWAFGCVFVLGMAGFVALTILQAAEERKPQVIVALLIVGALMFYVGLRMGQL